MSYIRITFFRIIQITFFCLLSSFLLACGKSDSNEANVTPLVKQDKAIKADIPVNNLISTETNQDETSAWIDNEKEQQSPPLDSENEEISPIKMEELVADADFRFINKKEISVQLNFKEYKNKRAYVSIYQNFVRIEDDKLFPVADSRVLAGPLESGEFNKSFMNLAESNNFLVELWFYDETNPIQHQIDVIDNKLSW